MAQLGQRPTSPVKLNVGSGKAVVQRASFWRDDFPFIRKASLRFGVCLLVASICIGASQFFLYQQEAHKQLAQAALVQAQAKYAEAMTEKNNIRDFRAPYVELVKRGFVGEEKRLDAIELIRSIQENNQLFPINYTISPQQIVTIDPTLFSSELDLYASKLTFHMGLLHELDVFTLINQLREKATLIPQTCSIKVSEAMSDAALPEKLDAQCSLFLMTMNRRVVSNEAVIPNE